MTHRRKFTAEFKAEIVLAPLSGAKSSAELCREHQIAPSVLADWKAIFLTRAASLFDGPEPRSSQDAPRIAALERLVGRWALEHDSRTQATSILHHRSRPSARSSRGSANSILCAMCVVGWATRAITITIGLNAVTRRRSKRRSST